MNIALKLRYTVKIILCSGFLVPLILISALIATPAMALDDLLSPEIDRSLGSAQKEQETTDGMDTSTAEVEVVVTSETVTGETEPLPVLTLDDAVEMALQNNSTLEIARQAVELTRAGGNASMAEFLPDLYFTYAWTHAMDANVIELPDMGEFELTPQDSFFMALTLSYTLYNGGQDEATERANMADEEAAEYQLKQAEAFIRLAVTGAYTGVLETEAALEATRESGLHLQELVHVSQASYDQGLLPYSDLLAVQVAKSQAAIAVADLQRALDLAKSALAIMVSSEITNRWALVSVDYPESTVPYDIETLWDWALTSRPEMLELTARREALEARMDGIRSMNQPRVSLEGTVSRTGADPLGSGQETGGTNVAGTVSIFWDLYNFGRTDDLLGPLEEQMTLIDLQQSDLEDSIRQEVESAYLGLQTRLSSLIVSRDAIMAAEEAFRVSSRRYEEGLGLMLEVLDAEASLARTEADYARILYDYFRGIASLAHAVGMTTEDLVALMNASLEEQ